MSAGIPEPAIRAIDPSAPVLYLSRRLEWFEVSAEGAAYYAPAVVIGKATYYRVDPPVYAWFERALTAKCADPGTAATDRAEIGRVWGQVVEPNACRRLQLADLAAARASGGALPPDPVVPAVDVPSRLVPRHLAPLRRAG